MEHTEDQDWFPVKEETELESRWEITGSIKGLGPIIRNVSHLLLRDRVIRTMLEDERVHEVTAVKTVQTLYEFDVDAWRKDTGILKAVEKECDCGKHCCRVCDPMGHHHGENK